MPEGGDRRGASNVSAKGIEWKVAIMAVVSVEVGSFLMAVEGIVGGVKVDDDFPGFFRDRFDPLADDEVFNGSGIGDDFLIARVGSLRGKFEPIESGVSGEGLALVVGIAAWFAFEITLADREGEGGITAEIIVIIEVFVAHDEGVDALGEEVGDGVLDEFLVTSILEAMGEFFDETTTRFDFAKEKSAAAITGEMPSLKICLHFS